MIITDEAKPLLQDILDKDQKTAFKVEIIKAGCHGQLYMDTTDNTEGEIINGFTVEINEEDKPMLDALTIDVKEGNLVFYFTDMACGCSGDCGGNCGEGCEGDCGGCCH